MKLQDSDGTLAVSALCDGGTPTGEDKPSDNKGVQSDQELYEIEVKGRDQETGKDLPSKVEKVTLDELKKRAMLGSRAAQILGAHNAEVHNEAITLATTMTKNQSENLRLMLESFAKTQKAEPELKVPTKEELLEDPNAVVDYWNKREKLIMKKVEGRLTDERKDTQRLSSYNDIINAEVKKYPFLSRKILIDILNANETAPEDVPRVAKITHDEIVSKIDLSKLPEEQRSELIAAHLKKTETPKAPPTGTSVETKDKFKPAKTWDEFLENEKNRLEGFKE